MPAAPATRVKSAASSVDITPPVGIALHNWSHSPHATATGIHRPLVAALVAIRDVDGTPALIVSLDLGWWMSAADESAVRTAVLKGCGLDERQLILALTHTHSGPSIARADAGRPGGDLIGPYLDTVAAAISMKAIRLFDELVPSDLDWATGRCGLAVNRDLYREDEQRFVVGANETGPADDTVIVGRVSALDGRTIAIIVNYAAHPTTLGGFNSLISPDYLGRAREIIESQTGAAFVFLQGASGDLAPREQYVSDVAVADRNGEVLGYSVLSALSALGAPATTLQYHQTIESGAPLGMFTRMSSTREDRFVQRVHPVALATQPNTPAPSPDANIQADRELRASRVLGNVEDTETLLPVTVWKIGAAVVVAYPGEAYSALQRALRTAFPGVLLVFVNLANGAHQGYIAPVDAYDDGRYPAWQSPLARGSFERLCSVLTKVLTELTMSSPVTFPADSGTDTHTVDRTRI